MEEGNILDSDPSPSLSREHSIYNFKNSLANILFSSNQDNEGSENNNLSTNNYDNTSQGLGNPTIISIYLSIYI